MLITDEQLKDLLVKNNIVDEKNFQILHDYAKNSGSNLIDSLLGRNIISDEKLGLLIAGYLHYPFIDLSKITIPDDVFHLIPEKVARKQSIIPFEKDSENIKLAMSDPTNADVIQMITKKTGLKVTPYLTTERAIENIIKIYRKGIASTFEELLKESMNEGGLLKRDEEAPIAKIVDELVEFAYQDKASDIHIEPQEKNSLVRFRIDGVLHDMITVPKDFHERIISRIKILSRLRTDEHLSPQDGKMRVSLEDEDLDIRVSILPVADGEKAVLRLLASKTRKFSLADLGMNGQDLAKVIVAYNKSYGMILSTGPTGSGKTTSIYAILKILNTREKNITTIEDPVEYRIKGVNQIQVNQKADLTFANGLRSILRQDPNIVFVGEIRDDETAGIAVNAALTGHLVLSTLHTNDSATALPRLIDMGVEPFLVASTVNIIIAQRLVRRICDVCKVPRKIKKSDLSINIPPEVISKHFPEGEELTTFHGNGCKNCYQTGYTGRIGIFEVLEVSKEIKKLITDKRDSDVIVRQAISEGMGTMLDDGLNKVANGTTTIEEILRATKVEKL